MPKGMEAGRDNEIRYKPRGSILRSGKWKEVITQQTTNKTNEMRGGARIPALFALMGAYKMNRKVDNYGKLDLHADKSVVSLKGYPRDYPNLDTVIRDISQCGEIQKVGDHRIKGLYRRLKRYDYGDGLVDVFYDRDLSVKPWIEVVCSVRATSEDKTDYSKHHGRLLALDEILRAHAMAFHISQIELAVDTTDRAVGTDLARYAFPKWQRGKHLQVVGSAEGVSVQEGVNDTGMEQYYNSREDFRQWHCYERAYDGGCIYRTETSFRRGYLRPKHINTHTEAMEQAEALVQANMALKMPREDKLRKDYRQFKRAGKLREFTALSLDCYMDKSSVGLFELLLEKTGFSRAEINRRYFYTEPFPKLWLQC